MDALVLINVTVQSAARTVWEVELIVRTSVCTSTDHKGPEERVVYDRRLGLLRDQGDSQHVAGRRTLLSSLTFVQH